MKNFIVKGSKNLGYNTPEISIINGLRILKTLHPPPEIRTSDEKIIASVEKVNALNIERAITTNASISPGKLLSIKYTGMREDKPTKTLIISLGNPIARANIVLDVGAIIM